MPQASACIPSGQSAETARTCGSKESLRNATAGLPY